MLWCLTWHMRVCCRDVLTQFHSYELNKHVDQAYQTLLFGTDAMTSWVNGIACSQNPDSKDFARGSADAVKRWLLCVAPPSRLPRT
jgi:ADP-glucose pyrophosphorylase